MPQQPRCKALWVTFDNSSHPHSKTASSYFRTPANCICLSVPLHSYFHWAGSLLFLMLRNMLPYFSVTSSPCPPKREPECIAFFVLAYSAPFSWPNVSNFLPSRKHWAFSSKSDKDSWLALPNAVWKEVIGVLWVEISAQLTRSPSPSLAIMETWHRGFSQTWSRVRGRFPQLTHMDLCSFEWVIILCGSKPLGPQAQLMWSWLIPSSFALSLSLSYACTHLVLLMDKLDAFICITLQFAFYHWIIHDGHPSKSVDMNIYDLLFYQWQNIPLVMEAPDYLAFPYWWLFMARQEPLIQPRQYSHRSPFLQHSPFPNPANTQLLESWFWVHRFN